MTRISSAGCLAQYHPMAAASSRCASVGSGSRLWLPALLTIRAEPVLGHRRGPEATLTHVALTELAGCPVRSVRATLTTPRPRGQSLRRVETLVGLVDHRPLDQRDHFLDRLPEERLADRVRVGPQNPRDLGAQGLVRDDAPGRVAAMLPRTVRYTYHRHHLLRDGRAGGADDTARLSCIYMYTLT